MNKIKLLACSLIIAAPIMAQDFPGYRAGNYTGVNGVFFNPANIADSRYRWDFNLFSLNTSLGNNNAEFKLKDISKTFNEDSIKNQLFGDKAGPASGLFSFNLAGPSVMFNVGKKMSFALTTRARMMANIKDIDGKLANKIINDINDETDLPYTITSNENMAISINAWTEYGASIARVLYDGGKHFLKGGLTLKYLAGSANAHLYINQLNTTLNYDNGVDDIYLSPGSGTIGLGFGGARISEDIEVKDLLSFESTGFGGDLGFVYEFRPDCEAKKGQRDENKYKLRVGVALLDIGSVKYKKDMDRSGAYDIDIDNSESFYLSDLDGLSLDDYNDFFQTRPLLFSPVAGNNDNEIKASLPTTLQLDVDYHFHRGFYLNVAGQLALSNLDTKPYNSQYYNSFSITPRFEGRAVGIYVPINYSELTKFNAGVSLRLGPLFVGSGSILTALFDKSKQADAHVGVRFGGLHKNK